jgi:hypothetical protein
VSPPFAHLAFLTTALFLSASLYGYRFCGATLRHFALALTLLTTASFTACVVAAVRGLRRPGVGAAAGGGIVSALPAFAAAAFAAMYHHLMLGGRCFSRVTLALSAASVLLGVVAIRRPRALGAVVTCLVATLVVNTAILLPRVPMLRSGGDMLNLIVGGVDRALSGTNPYVDLRVPDSEPVEYSARPLTYPPLMWLAYLPFRALGWDIRWMTVLSLPATFWLLARAVRGRSGRRVSYTLTAVVAGLAAMPLILVRATSIQTPVWWVLLLLLCDALARRERPWVVGVILGLIGLTRESAIVLAPTIAALVVRLGGRRALIPFVGAAVGVVAAGVVPFLVADHRAFVSSVSYNAAYAGRFELAQGIPLTHIGFGGWLLRAGWGSVASLVQLAAALGAAWYVGKRARSLSEAMVVAGATYFAFVACNAVIHEYYYVPSLLLVGLGLSMPAERLGAKPR